MTERLPGGTPRPFTPAELDGASGLAPDEIAAGTRVARELEALAAKTHVAPSNEFTERVMGAIAAEPLPAPARLAGLAIRRHSLGALVFSIRDAWRVMTSAGFPVAARAQAMALVLVVAALATGSGMATAGALGLFDGSHDSPSPSVEQPSNAAEPSSEPSADPSAEPSGMSAEPSGSPEPSETAGDESAEPDASTEPPESSNDHGGSGGATATPIPTPRPTSTPTPTPSPSDNEDHSQTPDPSRTPRPSDTPHPD